ncbi:ABC transporter ATP-binding protein [Enterococcus pallens]|uniref:ABC transporter ATP-binding protein n=1 Tax=Enterococcus pallens ATCC BAA-351 TaxID=1158607 RepID=R2SXC1_9ENTE|nr:ABC transporter ATP-binding protein [Enterococcus pallens]EOH97421.1 ABC transporter ATP-binding protein [Enterococcus pallens ATCC BAA-351]EOU21160.1 ABC transporter ATP-binding protein [Enterococcus pallens ATCC BAA-351]OJG80636.1 ABC transporter ATP-binding protein [Enterococcus pallens]
MTKPMIAFNNFTFQYHSQSEPTLKNLTVTINEGEKVLVVGPSGSGKSTFAHCINGLIPNQYEGTIQGEVVVDGKNIADSSLFELSFSTGTVLQDTDGQFIGLTVAEDIAFVLENDTVDQAQMKEQVARWAEVVDIDGHLDKRPQDLSGGQKQRVSMAGVLINEAPILLFDEPLANLDPSAGKEAIALIDRLHKDSKATVVIIEHRLEDVLDQPVDRVIVFNEGEIVADMKPDELLRSSVLAENGIREPLYVTSMKYAKVDLEKVTNLANLAALDGSEIKANMVTWEAAHFDLSPAEQGAPLLELSDLTYRYRKQDPLVIDHLSTTIHKGERISIVGKNGAGKSTLFKAICGFISPDGQMLWNGQDITKESIKERADKIGYVMQNPNQMISKKMIFDEVALGLVLRGVSETEIKERVEHALKVCGLYPFRNWPIAALSYGQKKRVTIAAILVLEPEMIILDEPTAGQDFRNYTEMMSFIEELNKLGKTVVMITHDMHLMLEYSDRALVIGGGKVLMDTTPIDVLTSRKLVEESSLKETSLFTFAEKIGLSDPIAFTRKFIHYDREVRQR